MHVGRGRREIITKPNIQVCTSICQPLYNQFLTCDTSSLWSGFMAVLSSCLSILHAEYAHPSVSHFSPAPLHTKCTSGILQMSGPMCAGWYVVLPVCCCVPTAIWVGPCFKPHPPSTCNVHYLTILCQKLLEAVVWL